MLSDGCKLTWNARLPERVRPLGGASCNRLIAVLRRAYRRGHEKRGLVTPLTFPHYEERARGEYLTEELPSRSARTFQARHGASVKADVFRLAYPLGIGKGQLRRTGGLSRKT
jgi:hypothetical protein